MAEYIEKQIAKERLCNLFQLQAATARAIIEAIPAADVVPVVRCKDCKHFHAGLDSNYCRWWDSWGINPDGFCSCGAKMEDST